MRSRILVTGATGNVGIEVVCLLHQQGATFSQDKSGHLQTTQTICYAQPTTHKRCPDLSRDFAGHQVRAAVRSPTDSSISLLTDVESVTFDFEQPQTFEPALIGITTLFLVRPPAISRVKKYIYPAIAAAMAAGVRHIVFLSLLGAERNRIVPHAQIEAYIKSIGLPYGVA